MNSYFRKISATNLFITPLLNLGRPNLIKLGFVDAFMKDELREIEYERSVYLLFKPINIEEFNLFTEEQRESNAPIIDEYDYGKWTILVYKLPKKFEDDYEKILQGKFSHVSEEYKKAIPKWYRIGENGAYVDKMNIQHMAFEKSDELKKYWKDELDLTITNSDEHWHHYFEREVLNKETLKRIEDDKNR